jgi:hypothetical protein
MGIERVKARRGRILWPFSGGGLSRRLAFSDPTRDRLAPEVQAPTNFVVRNWSRIRVATAFAREIVDRVDGHAKVILASCCAFKRSLILVLRVVLPICPTPV